MRQNLNAEHTEVGESNPQQAVLRVGCDGGDLTLWGHLSPKGWMFRVGIDESGVLDMTDEDVPEEVRECMRSDSPWEFNWRGALKQIDRYPWQFMYPLEVHRDFRRRVRDALKVRQKNGEINWDNWDRVLSETPKSQKGVEVSA